MSIFEYDEEREKKIWRRDCIEEGEDRVFNLIKLMSESGEASLLPKLYEDKEFRQQMYEKYNL